MIIVDRQRLESIGVTAINHPPRENMTMKLFFMMMMMMMMMVV